MSRLAGVVAVRSDNTPSEQPDIPGAVGIWHETFRVDTAESVYVSTKPMRLPKATELVEVGRRQDRAQARFAEGRTEAKNSEPAR